MAVVRDSWWPGAVWGDFASLGEQRSRKQGTVSDIGLRRKRMLSFEEELRKFKPSLEVDEIEEAVYQEDMSDMLALAREVKEQTR